MAYHSSSNLWLRWHSRCLGGIHGFLKGPWHSSTAWISFDFVALGINQDLGTLGNALPLSYALGALLLLQQGQPLFLQDRGDGIANGVYTESWHLLKVSQHNLSGTQGRLNKPLGQDTC